MSTDLKIELLIFTFFFVFSILYFIRNDKLNIRYAFIWLFVAAIMLISIITPNLIYTISHIIGFVQLSNMIFLGGILILLFICFSLTVIVSRQAESLKLLTQEVSILKTKVYDIKKL